MKRCKDEARMKEPLFREKWNTDAPAPLPDLGDEWMAGRGAWGPFDIVMKRNLVNEHKRKC